MEAPLGALVDELPPPGTVTVAVAVDPDVPLSCIEAGLTVQMAGAGTEQVSVTVWLNPFTGVSVMVLVA
jgi:hypothetical protein